MTLMIRIAAGTPKNMINVAFGSPCAKIGAILFIFSYAVIRGVLICIAAVPRGQPDENDDSERDQ